MDPILAVGAAKAGSDAIIRPHMGNHSTQSITYPMSEMGHSATSVSRSRMSALGVISEIEFCAENNSSKVKRVGFEPGTDRPYNGLSSALDGVPGGGIPPASESRFLWRGLPPVDADRLAARPSMNLVSTQHALLPCLAPDLSHRSLRGVSMEGRSTIVSPVRCGEASLSSGK